MTKKCASKTVTTGASIIKQKFEDAGLKEYSNNLNDMTRSQFVDFLVVTEKQPMSPAIWKLHQDNETKPPQVIQNIIEFFTKRDEEMLELFSGSGQTAILCSELNRTCTSVDSDENMFRQYLEKIEEDQFLTEMPYISSDAWDYIENCEKEFDFILIDPPRKLWDKSKSDKDGFKYMPVRDYCTVLAYLINSAAKNLKSNKYLVCFVYDAFHVGQMYHVPGIVSELIDSTLKFSGIKIYHRDVEARKNPNCKKYAPMMNHFYALIYRRENSDDIKEQEDEDEEYNEQ